MSDPGGSFNGYTGRLPPKGVSFSGFRYKKGQGFHCLKYRKGWGNLSFASVKKPKSDKQMNFQLGVKKSTKLFWFCD